MIVQALGLVQRWSRSELGDRRRWERSGSGGAVQAQAIRQDRGPVLGLSEDRLCGRCECGRLAGGDGEEVGAWEGGEGGEYWKIRAHRPGIRGSAAPAANRVAKVPDGGGGLQNTTGCSFERSLDSPTN